jgi:hypothetical protein
MEEKRICRRCGAEVPEYETRCRSCGSEDIGRAEAEPSACAQAPAGDAAKNESSGEYVLAGIVGALLLGLVGGLVYFLLYQIDIIAGISAVVIFVLANFGYGLFTGNTKGSSVRRVIICFVITAIVIFVAEYLSCAFELYKAIKEEGMGLSYFDAVRLMPEALKDPEVNRAILGDLAIAYLFGALAAIPTVINMVKNKKRG